MGGGAAADTARTRTPDRGMRCRGTLGVGPALLLVQLARAEHLALPLQVCSVAVGLRGAW
eukprot:SAG31_NODE_2194_length_6224_cov_3.140408_2_plen_60_part_00